MPDAYLFITPYLNGEEAWKSLQLATSDGSPITPTQSLALVQHHETAPLLNRFNWLVSTAPEQSALAEHWPAERTTFIVRLPTTETPSEEWRRGVAFLRSQHVGLALAMNPDDTFPPAEGPWDALMLSISPARTLPAFQLGAVASGSPLIINEVKSRNDFTWAATHGASLVSNEYLLARGTPSGKPDMTRLKLLELLSLIVQDADTREMEDIFKQEPKLSYSLLRLVNTAALSGHGHVESFVQAINLMGRKQLQRWLQLLIYADPNNGQGPTPLLKQAACRGRIMELLQEKLPAEARNPGDAAFMVGTFSLLDVLLSLPITEVVGQLPLAPAVKDALTLHEGPLGKLLTAIDMAERRDLQGASHSLAALGINPETYLDVQLNALSWASRLDG